MNSFWTVNVQTEEHDDEIENFHDGSVTVASQEEEEQILAQQKSASNPVIRTTLSHSEGVKSTSTDYVDGALVYQPYKKELLERQLFSNTPGMARGTAIIKTLQSREYQNDS